MINMKKIGALLITILTAATTAYAAPYYDCYDTYADLGQKIQQWNQQYPNLVEVIDAGDSWEKQQGKANRDLWVVRVTNEGASGEKPAVFFVGEHHARELASSQVLIDFIENELLAKYGSDPTITNLLDTRELHILPMANPDGHVKAENGQNWRKNTNDSNGSCQGGAPPNNYGVDMNRNYSKEFGGIGASSNPCSATYHGPSAFSEVETQALRDYIDNLQPQIVLSYHAFSNLILYPWGYSTQPTQHAQQFNRLAQKLSELTATDSSPSTYGYGQTSQILYQASGDTTDWFYDKYQLPTFTFEVGSSFWPRCSAYQTIYEKNVKPMLFAAQVADDPWNIPSVSPTASVPTLPPSGTPAPTNTPIATPTATPGNPADINQDGQVNQQDLQILLNNWSLPAPFLYPRADINNDSIINSLDAGVIFTAW